MEYEEKSPQAGEHTGEAKAITAERKVNNFHARISNYSEIKVSPLPKFQQYIESRKESFLKGYRSGKLNPRLALVIQHDINAMIDYFESVEKYIRKLEDESQAAAIIIDELRQENKALHKKRMFFENRVFYQGKEISLFELIRIREAAKWKN